MELFRCLSTTLLMEFFKFFVVDPLTGEHLITSKFSARIGPSRHWMRRASRCAFPKDHHIAGALVSNANQGAANWPPPSFSPKTGLFYVPIADTYVMYYLTERDPRGALGLGGKDERSPTRSARRADAVRGEAAVLAVGAATYDRVSCRTSTKLLSAQGCRRRRCHGC